MSVCIIWNSSSISAIFLGWCDFKKGEKNMKYLLWNRYCKEDAMNVHFNSEGFSLSISTTLVCFSNNCDPLRKKELWKLNFTGSFWEGSHWSRFIYYSVLYSAKNSSDSLWIFIIWNKNCYGQNMSLISHSQINKENE